MNYAIVYSSRTGNTQKLAEVIRKQLDSEDCVYYGSIKDARYDIIKADRIYVGFWTNQGKCDDVSEKFIKSLRNHEIFLFGTAGFGESEEYFKNIINNIKKIVPSDVKVVDSFICQGSMPMSVREKYEKLRNSPAPVPNLEMLIKNFDNALGHPNAIDIQNLIKKL